MLSFVILSGCTAMSDRGDVSQTAVRLPDGSKMTFVRIQRIRLFTPSTEEKVTFIQTELEPDKVVRIDNLEQNYQNGMGPSLISGAIQAGATVGGAYLVGQGLEKSGDKINNGSASGSRAGAASSSRSSARTRQSQGQLQGQGQSQRLF